MIILSIINYLAILILILFIVYLVLDIKNIKLLKLGKSENKDKVLIDKWINSSIKKANVKSITGKELTPFLINEINSLSNNKTLNTNIKLIINNALIAGQIAAKYF